MEKVFSSNTNNTLQIDTFTFSFILSTTHTTNKNDNFY